MMGILNVTPDSFSDGGLWLDRDRAVARGQVMIEEGADVVDVGGESTRPGADPVTVDEELRRVVPVIEALAGQIRLSVDTTKAEVAEAAVEAGASLINDVSASLWPVAARTGAGWVAMHRQGTPTTMQSDPHYDDVVAEVTGLLVDRARRLGPPGWMRCGSTRASGSGRRWTTTSALLASLEDLVDTGYPVVVGTSRKTFLGHLAASASGPPLAVDQRLAGSVATATWAMSQGVRMVRVHDVAATVQAAVLVGSGGVRRDPGAGVPMKGKWAAGIPPRNFTWVIKDRLAMSERPGGFAPNHRKVRRQEEIIWLQVQGFTRVVSLLPSSHNLQAYEEKSMASVHFPLPPAGDARAMLADLYRELHDLPGRRRAGPHPPRGARRPGHRRHGRLPALVGPATQRSPGHHRARAHDRPPHGPERSRAGGLRRRARTGAGPARGADNPLAGG